MVMSLPGKRIEAEALPVDLLHHLALEHLGFSFRRGGSWKVPPHVSWVRQRVSARQIPFVRIGGWMVRFRPNEIRALSTSPDGFT